MDNEIQKIISRAIHEDRIHHDITTQILVPASQVSEAFIVAKEDSVICGLDVIAELFRRLDPNIKMTFFFQDGNHVKKNTRVAYLKGRTRALLSGERVSLNFLSYLSGIATLTDQYVRKVRPYRVKVMDTRKTIPGLRALVKMAVRAGGGVNHRFNLKEMVMIKDNHHAAYRHDKSIPQAIVKVRQRTTHKIVVEVDTLHQFQQALEAQPDIILLDNMTVRQLKRAVQINRSSPNKCLLEASGGITLRNVRAVAKTEVERISIGALTHSARAKDFSMEFGGDSR